MMNNITREIFPLSMIVLCAFVVWGFGYLAMSEMEHASVLKSECIAAGKQVIERNCVE